MIEETLWHPVTLACELADAPMAVRLLSRDVVLWRDATGTAQAWADQCPHRGARLSLGRVSEGRLECPYHGWLFDASARCVAVPALPGFVPPAGHRVQAVEAREAHGLVWVRLQASDSQLPVFAAEEDTRLRKLDCGPYDVATSAPRIVENFLDMAHFSFIHEGWLGSRDAPVIDDYRVERTATGLRASDCKAWQPRSNLHSHSGAQVSYDYEVTAPYSAVLTKEPEAGSTTVAGWREAIALFICPIEPDLCRVWFRQAVVDFDTPQATLQEFQNTIFLQDQPVLESQKPKALPLDVRAEAHTAADKASSAYRRYLQDCGITFGTC